MRVAIIHYWMVGRRGGEKVLEELCKMYPQADVFTHVLDAEAVGEDLANRVAETTFINKLPFARRLYKFYLPLMPIALEQLDLQEYDLIISSEAGPAKGVIARPDALHICYCHSPMRYVWNMYWFYRRRAGVLTRMLMPLLAHYMRAWDVASATRVHRFVANSSCVAERIGTYYGREAEVIHPPVAVEDFHPVAAEEIEDFYLVVGELVAYKRVDIAIAAAVRLQRRLVVIGGGEQLNEFRKETWPGVQILGPQPKDVLQWHYARCKALIFPGLEDFGIVPVEAMASGRPVVAFGQGGALESVVDAETGVFFGEQTAASCADAMLRFEQLNLSVDRIVKRASEFDARRFQRKMKLFVDQAMSAKKRRVRKVNEANLYERLRPSAAGPFEQTVKTDVVATLAQGTRSTCPVA